MIIRKYQPGDEAAQIRIYNEAACQLPAFKKATLDEVRRRLIAPKKDRTTRFLAIDGNQPLGYASYQTNGRVSFPWCFPGQEGPREELFNHVLGEMKAQGITRAFAAYRPDWTSILEWFESQGFVKKREMINYSMDIMEMPTVSTRSSEYIEPLTDEEFPWLVDRIASWSIVSDPEEIRASWLSNPWIPRDSLFAYRSPNGIEAVGALIANSRYAKGEDLDGKMPCFRLGALGTEGLTWKRVNGLFSFVVENPNKVSLRGLDLLSHAYRQLEETSAEVMTAQIPSDVEHLVYFYRQYFQEQGRFPLLERELTDD